MKKTAGDIIILHSVPKTTILWGTVPEIRRETDIIICHLGPFFVLLHPSNPENQNFEKMKKIPGDIVILHICTINENI